MRARPRACPSGIAEPVRRVVPRPVHDVLRVADDLPVVENEYGNEALAGQSLDLPASAGDVRQRGEAVGLDDVWRVASCLHRVVRVLARVRAGTPRGRLSW